MKTRIISGTEFPYHGEILFNDGARVIIDMHDGTGRVYAYKLTEYKAPMTGKNTRAWLSCGVWKRVICGYREVEKWDARTVKDLSGIASAYA